LDSDSTGPGLGLDVDSIKVVLTTALLARMAARWLRRSVGPPLAKSNGADTIGVAVKTVSEVGSRRRRGSDGFLIVRPAFPRASRNWKAFCYLTPVLPRCARYECRRGAPRSGGREARAQAKFPGCASQFRSTGGLLITDRTAI